MAFFTRPAADTFPLFRLLADDCDSAYTRPRHCTPTKRAAPTFTPRFDVRELADEYTLEGELAGVQQKDIEIDFTDVQTLRIRGHADHRREAAPAPADAQPAAAPIAEKAESVASSSHNATVEDEFVDVQTPGTETRTVAAPAEKAPVLPAPAEAPKPRYWISERSTGSFQRAFSFPDRVDQDAVQASLRDGILRIVVPKLKGASRRISIQ